MTSRRFGSGARWGPYLEREIGSSYEATLWRKPKDGTRKGCAGALYKFLRYSRINSFLAPHEALKGRMLQVARDGQYESPVKALLSKLHLAEKMSIIPAIVVPADWLFAEPVERLRILRNPRNIRWAEGDIICKITKRKATWEWKELECLGMAACHSRTCCASAKRGRCPHQAMASFASRGRGHRVENMSRSLGPGRRVGCGSSEKNVRSVGWPKTPHMGISRQRDWKRHWWRSWQAQSLNTKVGTACGEAERRGCGPQNAGRWESPSLARHYTKPKHAWKFVERGKQPVPVCGENGYRLVYGDWSSKQWWPACYEKSAATWQQRHKRMASSGTDWTGCPKKEKDPICRIAKGRVGGSGCMDAAWGRSRSWERSWTWT